MAGEILRGREQKGGAVEGCDVVVVGSGAGGAVVATQLAEAGLSVVVLEEGPHYTPDEYSKFKPTESMRRMWREAGMLAAFGVGNTPIIAITVGRNVGGSSVHTGGVCFRIPSSVHRTWERDHGLPELSERAFEQAYLDVERRCHIGEVPAEGRSLSTQRFIEGAGKLGIEMHPMRRNTHGCEGNGRCNFGCPKKAKLSVDQSFLPRAVELGARIYSDALVSRVLFDGDRVRGVEGVFLGDSPVASDTKRTPFTIRARAVVLACGTLHTPLLLMASGIGNKHVGRHLTLHPSARVCATFKERLQGWDGVLQSVYSNHFESDGIHLNGVFSPPNVLAAGFPNVGPAHRELVRKLPHLAVFGGMVHDEAGGVVRPAVLGREGVISYEMAPRDFVRLRRSMTILGELALAGGAEEVYLPVFGTKPFRDVTSLRRFEQEPLDARRVESLAFHPLGTARIANDPRRGVTAPSGEVYGVSGLWVADGSVVPTSVGVNSQLPIMSMATRISWVMREKLTRKAPRPASSQPGGAP